MSRPNKIVMVSVPYTLDNSFFKEFMSEPKKDFVNEFIGIPWAPRLDFETMTEYNGFLVEV